MVLMANPLIEGPIPLGGAGFIAKENGNFQPGEYKRLNNLEIDSSGFLINRRNVYNVNGENTGAAVDSITNPQRFMGSMGEYSLISTGEDQYLVGESTFLPLWSLSAGSGPSPSPSYSIFLGFFRYNNMNFWLVFEFQSGVDIALAVYYDAAIPVPDTPETYAAGYEASLTREVILSFNTATTDFYEFQYRNFFIYKERLWIATSVGLYFSAATDPTDFTVPNGGFFKHPGNTVNYAMAIKDQVYTLCDDAVYALTYNTDPNLDSTERPLSDSIGGEMGCIHLDTAYFINNQGIYVINGTNVDKVMDSRFDYGTDAYRNHIYSFDDYIVVNKYTPVNYDNNYSPPAVVSTRRNLVTRPESDSIGGEQIITGWTTEGSDPLPARTNLQVNSNVNFDPNDATIADYGDGAGDANVDLGIDTVTYYLSPSAGTVSRTSGEGTYDMHVQGVDMPCTEGLPYAVSAYVRTPGAGIRDVSLIVVYEDNTGVNLEETVTDFDVTASTWTRISSVTTAPTDAVTIYYRIQFNGIVNTNDHWWDAVLVEQSDEVKSYFDGDFVDDDFKTYAFTGVSHKSTSTLNVLTSLMDPIDAVDDGINDGLVLRFGGEFVNPDDLEGADTVCWGSATKVFEPTTALVPGIPYHFRFSHKGNGSWEHGVFDVLFEFLSAGDVVLGSSTREASSDYNPAGSYSAFWYGGLVFPENTTKLRVTLTLTLDIADASGTTVWSIDANKFHLEKGSTFSGYFTGDTTDTDDVVYSWDGVAFQSESITGAAETHGYLKNNGSKFEPFQQGNSLGYNTYFINTENGAVHVLDFLDQYTDFSHGGAGFIVEALVNPYSDSSGNGKMLFLTNKMVTEDESGATYSSNVYYMSTSEDSSVQDFAVNSAGVLTRRPPKIDVEWDSFVPDGLEYRMKKFRSLLLQGVLPPDGMRIEFSYDNEDVLQITDLGDDETSVTDPRRHFAHRLGLNQRGHSLTIRLRNIDWADEISGAFGDLEISDMRLLWTYTQRLPNTKRIGS